MTLYEKIYNALDEMLEENQHELVRIHNEWATLNGLDTTTIYFSEDLEHNFKHLGLLEIIEIIQEGCFAASHEFYTFDCENNILSFPSYELRDFVDLEEIALYCKGFGKALGNPQIEKLINDDDLEKITICLDDEITGIITMFQKEKGIKNGDIFPLDAYKLDSQIKKLAQTIQKILDAQQ